MERKLFNMACLSAVLVGLMACSSAPVKKAAPLSMASVKAPDEPCWVRTPDCRDVEGDSTLYFVGQSKEPLASRGQPPRASFHSAQRDAEQEYARYLGVDIESSSYLMSLFKDEEYQLQFEETIQETVEQRVSELKKADEYFVAYERTEEGEPLWTVYVLLKIAQEHVQKHQAAIAQEAYEKANAPAPPDEWVASLFNIDDSASVFVNGTKINQCDFSQSCEVRLTPHLQAGSNKVRLEYINHLMFWTYGYEVLKNGEVMYEGRCGQVWLMGCGFLDTKLGVVHTFEFEVMKAASTTTE